MDQILQMSLQQNRRDKMADDGNKNSTRSNYSGQSRKSEITTARTAKRIHDAEIQLKRSKKNSSE